MKKKKLLGLKKLTATDEMVQMAKADIPQPKQVYQNVEYIYKYGMYIMAEVEDNILKVAFFLTDHLTLNATEPLYSLFIDREKDDFIGYDYIGKKWTCAMLDKIMFSRSTYRSGKYCNDIDAKCIQEYVGNDWEAYDALLKYQREQRERRLLKRHKRLTDQWDLAMKEVPKVQKGWERWIEKVGFTQNFIFYEYTRKGATQGYCTWCEKDVPIQKPRHNKEGVCSCCHHKIKYKALKKANRVITENETAYLVQHCGNGFVIREFMVRMMVQMSAYKKPMYRWYERRRFLYDSSFKETEYYYGYDATTETYRWKQGDLMTTWGPGWRAYVSCVRGQVYKRNLWRLKKGIIGRTGLAEYLQMMDKANPCEYLVILRKQPILELLAKAGLKRMTIEVVNSYKLPACKEAKELGKVLGIDQFRLKRLREMDGGIRYLEWLRYEKEQNTVISDSVLEWMQKNVVQPTDITFIQNKMSVVQIKNYLERQSAETGEKVKDLLNTWEDYLIMAKRAGRNITDPIIYRARYLVRRHDEMVQILGNKNIVQQAEAMEQKYPLVPEIIHSLQKYEYADKDYKVVAPQRIEDILLEGEKLQHCVHNSERYFERMSKKEAYILFLRKTEAETVPYYTLEIEPNGTVRQKRTLYNRQLEDIKEAEKFLQKWQKQLQKKLHKEDYELAERSKELRILEMEELRKNQVRLNGNFNGKLLADVLAEDLMEVEALAA